MIDWDRVRELCSEVGEEDFQEIVDLFLEEVSEVTERLRTSPDLASLTEDLHFLKGCALNLGFRSLGQLCEAGESSSANGAPETVNIDAIVTVYDASKADFLANAQTKLAA